MVIAVDATPLAMSSGGIRRYTEELTRALASNQPDDALHLISDQPSCGSPRFPGNVSMQCWERRGIDRRWWTVGAGRAAKHLRCQVFHGTNFSVPYLPLCPSILTLHDLSPWRDPAWHHDARRVRRRTPLLLRLRVPTVIITPTEAVRTEASERFLIPPDRIFTTPYAPHLQRSQPYAHPDPYFLSVATLEPRKNLPSVIEAWRILRMRYRVDLLVAGRRRDDAPNLKPEPGLVILGEVDEKSLASLYSGAVGCVYPSLYEGFGLPPLEAMNCGCPTIVSNDPALREVSAGASLHVEARDVRALA
ncbi:MAG TPA: glycosyltransferase family 1 protein, partial [Bryobacteraceae bacterium]|nr:glycosyltransferase family 1 protein [Bryobacteraceae bacterium]